MATIYFFNGTQSGTADGSYVDPYDFSSLATQESASSSGDVFIFKDGTYVITANLTLGADGVTYEAETTGDVTFNFNSQYSLSLGDSANTYPGFTLKGIVFDNINGIMLTRIIDNDLLIAEDCQFKGMSSGYRCIIGDTAGSDGGYGLNAVFRRCVFVGTSSANEVRFFRYRLINVSFNLTLENCSVLLYGQGGMFETGTPGIKIVKNSILYADNSSSQFGGISLTENNNCYYNLIGKSANPANGIIVADPQFVDVANGDLRLRPTSPCIGAGTV